MAVRYGQKSRATVMIWGSAANWEKTREYFAKLPSEFQGAKVKAIRVRMGPSFMVHGTIAFNELVSWQEAYQQAMLEYQEMRTLEMEFCDGQFVSGAYGQYSINQERASYFLESGDPE